LLTSAGGFHRGFHRDGQTPGMAGKSLVSCPVVEAFHVHIDADSYQRVLGEELRNARRERGWTRKQLQQRLSSGISLQTLATYELGTRQCSVVRLAELCQALGVSPHDLLARVHQRLFAKERPGQIRVDLALVVRDQQPELLPLRRWAQDRLSKAGPGATQGIHLDLAALEQLAQLCDLTTADLISRLRKLGTTQG
jgi:transcriptional regulator with XRE-family HTH domain